MNLEKNLESGYVKSYYDNFLSNYEDDYSYYRWAAGKVEKNHFSQTKNTLTPYLNKLHGSVLEIGGGDGMWTSLYINRIEKLLFLDISKEMISRAQKRLSFFQDKISYSNIDFIENNLDSSSFDCVVSIRNLEYFSQKETFLKEVERVLKNDGIFILITKSPNYSKFGKNRKKILHSSQIDIKELIKIIKKSGLSVEYVCPAIFGKFLRFSFFRFVSTQMHFVFKLLPLSFMPLGFLSFFSESFFVYAKK